VRGKNELGLTLKNLQLIILNIRANFEEGNQMFGKILRIVFVLLIVILFICCDIYRLKVWPPRKPIIVDTNKCASISFKKVLWQIPRGTQVGGHFRAGHFDMTPYLWQVSITPADEMFNQVVNEELTNAGYKVIGADKLLFESDDSWKSDYLLGARILNLSYYTYAEIYNSAEAYIEVQWELFDKETRGVIFRRKTVGTSRTEEITGQECIYTAFANAAKELLADEKFVNYLRLSKGGKDELGETKKLVLIKKFTLPRFQKASELINRAIESVVTIKLESGFGSGVIISDDGYIITNNHVIEGRHLIDVILSSNIILQTEVIAANPDYDIALLKINGSGFKPLPIGDSDQAAAGEEVFAIGTPILLDLAQSVSRGIISGKRTLEKEKEYIQTDAAINPGNSGGPLINSKGEVIAIVARKFSTQDNLAFCIPINIALFKLGIVSK